MLRHRCQYEPWLFVLRDAFINQSSSTYQTHLGFSFWDVTALINRIRSTVTVSNFSVSWKVELLHVSSVVVDALARSWFGSRVAGSEQSLIAERKLARRVSHRIVRALMQRRRIGCGRSRYLTRYTHKDHFTTLAVSARDRNSIDVSDTTESPGSTRPREGKLQSKRRTAEIRLGYLNFVVPNYNLRPRSKTECG